MKRETLVPSIPDVRADNASDLLRAIKATLDVREGRIGDPLDQYVTLRDLQDLSIVSGGGSTTLTSGSKIPVVGPGIGSDGYDPTTDYTTPIVPTGLTITSGMTSIYLAWTGAAYRNHAYTEIWRSATNALGAAVRIGTTNTNLYADPVGKTSQTFYYWIRFVSVADVVGPYNQTAGTVGGTGLVGGADLSGLIITADKIASGAIDLSGTKITGLLANANMAVITDPTKIADSLIGNTKLANLAVDAAKLADSSVTSTKIANLAVGTAAIQTGAITTALIANAAIGSAQIADAAITSAKIGNLAVGNAAIQNAAITNAKIADLSADKITAGTLTAAISVNTGYIYGGIDPNGYALGTAYTGTGFLLGSYQGGYQFFVGSPSKNILWNGTDLTVKGVVYASAGAIGTMVLDSNGLHSSNYTAGSAGFAINNSGSAELNDVTVRGSIYSTNGQIGGNIINSTGIQSSNYASGTAGWRVTSAGSAEFNDVTVRGALRSSSIYTGSIYKDTDSGLQINPVATICHVQSYINSTLTTPYTNSSMRIWGPGGHASGQVNQRVRAGLTNITIMISSVVDHHLSVWYRLNGATSGAGATNGYAPGWYPIYSVQELQNGDGPVTLVYGGQFNLNAGDYIDFGVSAADVDGTFLNTSKTYMYGMGAVIMMTNL